MDPGAQKLGIHFGKLVALTIFQDETRTLTSITAAASSGGSVDWRPHYSHDCEVYRWLARLASTEKTVVHVSSGFMPLRHQDKTKL